MSYSRLFRAAAVGAPLLLVSSSLAVNYSWLGPAGTYSNPTSGNWNTSANWFGSPNVPPTDLLYFGGGGTGTFTSTNDTDPRNVAQISLNSTSTGQSLITGNPLNNYTGTGNTLTIIQNASGQFQITNDIQLRSAQLTLTGNGSGTVTMSGNLTQHSANGIGQPMNVVKSGSSTFVLTGNGNTYTFGTAIDGGMLLVNNTLAGSSGTGTGSVTVSSSARLGGSGTISGSITLSNTSQISGGNFGSAGKLTAGGSLSLASTSTLQVDVGGSGGSIGTAGVHFDQIALTNASAGTFSINTANLVVTILPGTVVNQPYPIITTALPGGIPDFFAGLADNFIYTVPATNGNVKYKLNYLADRVNLTFVAVPEPTTGIFGGCVLLAASQRRRIRR